MKKLTSTLIAAGVISGAAMSAPAMAEGPSANVGFVTDYVWRGDTQSDNKAAVQGGLDWEKDELSFGVWGSSLGTSFPGAELDVYGAYNFGPVAVGAIYYYYPEAGGNFYEVNVGGDLGPVSLMASYNPDASTYYVEGGFSYELTKGVSLDLHVGQQQDATADYSVGIATSAGGLDLGATYANKDEGVFFVSVGKSM